MIKRIGMIFIGISFLGLAGCAGMNSSFGCNARAGDSCTPVSKVNQNAEAGTYDNVDSGDEQSGESNTQAFGYANTSGNAGYNVATPTPGQPIRFGDTVQRIWIAPYEDTSKTYHEPSYVYTVLDKSHWIGLPAQEVSSNSDGD